MEMQPYSEVVGTKTFGAGIGKAEVPEEDTKAIPILSRQSFARG